MSDAQSWNRIHGERARVLLLLEDLDETQWRAVSSCTAWNVEDVVAHLTAAANTGTWAWIRSMLRARFNTDLHNLRLLTRFRGATTTETLDRYRHSIGREIAPTKDLPAYLGEVIVHGQDIARPLGLVLEPDPDAVGEVARFYAAKNFAVNSRRLIEGLRLEAVDADFSVGSGPLVRGNLLDLVVAMAGRSGVLESMSGDGVERLRQRSSAGH